MENALANKEQIWDWLDEVGDPELPMLSVIDLGIVRGVRFEGQECVVTLTPTYSGCPATAVIARDVESTLRAHGVSKLRIETRLSPAWTTDWLSVRARERLESAGVAPPGPLVPVEALVRGAAEETIICPRCGSRLTREVSRFGATPCKALHACQQCREPFESFKSH